MLSSLPRQRPASIGDRSQLSIGSGTTANSPVVREFFFFQAEDGIRDKLVTGVQTCALPICHGFGPKEFKFEMPEFGGKLFGHDVFLQHGPRLGIDAEDLSGQPGSYFGAPDGEGVLVRDVTSGTPAEKAGLKAGDVIIKIDGERVRTVHELREKMRAKRENKTVSVSVIRKGTEMSFNVRSEEHTSELQSLAYLVCRLLLE